MPELPEVEVLVRELAPLLRGQTILGVDIRRTRQLRPTSPSEMERALTGATIQRLTRRAKYLVFTLSNRRGDPQFTLLGHLGMTGRMYVQDRKEQFSKHTVIALNLGSADFVFEDMRGFGRWTLDTAPLERLGPEPLRDISGSKRFAGALRRSRQAIKIKLLDQSVIAGVGNIYASEALFDAGISPRKPANKLTSVEVMHLWQSVQKVLRRAIRFGRRVELDLVGRSKHDGLFYYGQVPGAREGVGEWFEVYDREDQPCSRCSALIRCVVQASRSTYYCPHCQPR